MVTSSRSPPTTSRVTLARLRNAFSTSPAQASPVILRAPVRQLLQVGGTNGLLCDIRTL